MTDCPLCGYNIKSGEPFVVCPKCHTLHHRECWQRNDRRCSVFQCTGTGDLPEQSILSANSGSNLSRPVILMMGVGVLVLFCCAIIGMGIQIGGWISSSGINTPVSAIASPVPIIASDLKTFVTPTPILSTSTSVPTRTPILPTLTPTLIQDGMVLVSVPAGDFRMGYDYVVHPVYTDRTDAIPEHTVYLDSFYIDKTEVTNGMYASCVKAGRCAPPSATNSNKYINYYGSSQYTNYPVIYIGWNDANAYCQWAGRRLPTEAEWEKAARGTDGRAYPWGNAVPNSTLLNFNFNIGDTTPVDDYSRGASPYGVLNMAGNVWEWVADWYNENYYASSPSRNPRGPSSGQVRSFRGGGYGNIYAAEVRATYRGGANPNNGSPAIGFRCAK